MMQKPFVIYATNTVAVFCIVLGIVLIVNYLAIKKAARYDLTENKVHSVSLQTVKVLKKVRDDVGVLAFFKEVGFDLQEFQELINQYRRVSERVLVDYIDPDREPGIAKKYGVTEYGTVVLISGENTVKLKLADPLTGGILPSSEERLTNALIKLSGDSQKSVFFLNGHGERDLNNYIHPKGIGRLKRSLEDESFAVKELLLMRDAKIPEGKNVFLVAAPTKPLLDKEVEEIKIYIESGGLTLFLLEPRSGKQLVRLLNDYGINLSNDVVVDPSSKLVGGGDIAPIVAEYPLNDITEDFMYATIFPFSRSLEVEEQDGVEPSVTAVTSGYAWSETNLILFDEGVAEFGPEDRQGPLALAAVAELKNGGRIAVFGSVDFISNRFIDFSGNLDLFMNTLNWLVRDEDLISIRPREAKEGKLNLQPKELRRMMLTSIILVPVIVLLVGATVWIKRRNL